MLKVLNLYVSFPEYVSYFYGGLAGSYHITGRVVHVKD